MGSIQGFAGSLVWRNRFGRTLCNVASLTGRIPIFTNILGKGWVITAQPFLSLVGVIDILSVHTKIRLTREQSLIALRDDPLGECPWLI